MAGVVNIRRDVDDKFYRYRMPVLLTKIEGKGNGIKTVLPNISDVAKALSRPPTYPTKFFGCELGAQTTFDEKADRYIVNGAHEANRLRELLDSFIDKFVLCGACKNPETDLILTKTEDIIRDCKACGQQTKVDMRHKLTTFIIKNPPKVTKKYKGGAAPKKTNPETGSNEGSADDGSDDELMKKIKAEAADQPDGKSATEDWSADTSPDAVRARMKDLEGAVQKSLVLAGEEDSDGEGADSPYAALGLWAQENRQSSNAVDAFRKAQELGIEKKHKSVLILSQALFTDDALSEIPNFLPLFTKMVTSEKHQKALLGGLERLVGMNHPELIASIPKILMIYYQGEVLEEEVIKQWGTHVSKKYVDRETSKMVRKAGEPFLKWLEEAADESEEEE